jgi:hypothetical protein
MLSSLSVMALGQVVSSGPTAASTFGVVGITAQSGEVLACFGPYENGYGATPTSKAQLLELGCTDPSVVSIPGGIDTHTSQEMIAHKCGVDLPRYDPEWTAVLDECGRSPVHTTDKYHESLGCLYNETGGEHSPKIGHAADVKETPIYGKWEDYSELELPALDACNAHFGITPESNGKEVYHHHVAGLPPFVVGCYGPAAGDETHPEGKLVSFEACRSLYAECANEVITIVTEEGETTPYVPFCPCFDEDISNVSDEPIDVITSTVEVGFTASGTVEDYGEDEIDALETFFKDTTNAEEVDVTVEPASVLIKAAITVADQDAGQALASSLVGNGGVLSDSAALTQALSTAGISISVEEIKPPKVTTRSSLWPGCTAADLEGDFDASGHPTLGDAHHIAVERLNYGESGVNPVKCMEGDFDGDGTFTVNDAAQVAQAQFKVALLPWQTEDIHHTFDRRQMGNVPDAFLSIMTIGEVDRAARTAQLRVERADGAKGSWRAVGAQFTSGISDVAQATISSVRMHQNGVTELHKGLFLEATDLSGRGHAWPMGAVATVTFAPGTDMTSLQIDYKSINTYLVQNAEPLCETKPGASCKIVTAVSMQLSPLDVKLKLAKMGSKA